MCLQVVVLGDVYHLANYVHHNLCRITLSFKQYSIMHSIHLKCRVLCRFLNCLHIHEMDMSSTRSLAIYMQCFKHDETEIVYDLICILNWNKYKMLNFTINPNLQRSYRSHWCNKCARVHMLQLVQAQWFTQLYSHFQWHSKLLCGGFCLGDTICRGSQLCMIILTVD